MINPRRYTRKVELGSIKVSVLPKIDMVRCGTDDRKASGDVGGTMSKLPVWLRKITAAIETAIARKTRTMADISLKME
jgi:hypothetical protein